MAQNNTDPTEIAPRPAEEIAETLQALEQVPATELPDGPARMLLAECIRRGYIDHVYRPMILSGPDGELSGRRAVFHNLSIASNASNEPGRFVRRTVAEWIYAYEHGEIEVLVAGRRLSCDPEPLKWEEAR